MPHKDFSIGDVLEKFIVRISGSRNIYSLNEGITILVDGEEAIVYKASGGSLTLSDGKPIETNIVTGNQFGVVFKDNEHHTVQAVYKGNDEIGMASSSQISITPLQKNDGSQTGAYVLTQTLPKKWKYLENPRIVWKLTRNGSPVANKVIERVLPNATWTATTNSKGEVVGVGTDPLYSWTVGKYKIGGQFYHYDGNNKDILAECWDTIEIVKNTPTLTFIKANKKGNTAQFRLTDPQGFAMPNRVIVITIGSQTYTKTTDSIGKVYVRINRTGYFTYKATYGGDSNYNSVTATGSETITG